MSDFKVICLNDKGKPDGFIGTWIKKGEVYTVIDCKHLARQRMVLGYKLQEAPIDENSKFQFFVSNRFRPYNDEDSAMQKAVEELLEEVENEYA